MAASYAWRPARGLLDRFANAHVGTAAADISGHRGVDIGVIGIWGVREQGCCRHDLARLAITALDHFRSSQAFCTFAPAGVAPMPSMVVTSRSRTAPTAVRRSASACRRHARCRRRTGQCRSRISSRSCRGYRAGPRAGHVRGYLDRLLLSVDPQRGRHGGSDCASSGLHIDGPWMFEGARLGYDL